jgi:rhodanese-related sulfurtransferase
VDKRIDVLAMAIQARMTVFDLEEAELAYAPQYGAAKDPINIVGFVAANALRGDEEFIYAEELTGEASGNKWTIIDVRTPREHEDGHIPGAVLIPLTELRQRWQEIPRDRPIVLYCEVGHRAYYANRILRQNGVQARNLAGGLNTYQLVHAHERQLQPVAS